MKICDAYGAGFFFIPGTDTCLRVGGMVMAEWAISNAPNLLNGSPGSAANVAGLNTLAINPANAAGTAFQPNVFRPGQSRDSVANAALGRIELDARTQSPWGTIRAFARVDSYFGSGAVANTGGFTNLATTAANFNGGFPARETTVLNKAFLQFAGITMGRIQSMFDFYADAIGYNGLRGSNATVNALAYTLTAGGGFSATLAVEDNVSRRTVNPSVVQYNSAALVTGSTTTIAVPGFVYGAPTAVLNGTRLPEIVANLRLDQPWGSAQLSGAIHQIRGALSASGLTFAVNQAASSAFSVNPGFYPAQTSQIGFAVQGGLKFNLDMLAPGDVLWLQATYAKGAVGYIAGNNLAFASGGPNNQLGYGSGPIRVSSSSGWQEGQGDADCVFTYSGSCDKSSGFAVDAALRHYWTPTVSSTLSGNYYQVSYSANSLNPGIGAALMNSGSVPFGWGITNYKEFLLATGLEWNPVKGFGIGTEIAWTHGIVSRPVGLAPDTNLMAAGMPAFKSQADLIRGRVRMYRMF